MGTELDRRKEAMRLYHYQHLAKAEICRRLNCSRPWLDRWLKRYDPDDVDNSLSNRSTAPQQARSPWSTAVRQQVLAMRRARSDRIQWPYALIGAAAIHYELLALKNPEVPPVRTIHRWLVAAGLVEREPAAPSKRESKPIPLPQASAVNDVQQFDLKGPVYLRGSGHKYYLPVLRDCYSRRCAIGVLNSKQAQGIANFLVANWAWMGLPQYLQLDNALELRGSNRYPRSFGRVVRVALDLGIEVVFNPPGEPWRNGGVEWHNGFLNQRLRSVECTDLAALEKEAQVCQNACNQTHRLSVLHGQTPNEVAAQATLHLLAASYDKHQARSLPQDKGFVSFVRLVRKSGRITLGAGDRFMVDPELAYTYILARVNLAERVVVISQNGKDFNSYDYSVGTVGAWADDDPDEAVNEPDM